MEQVITASRLEDGIVVFVGAEAGWVDRLDAARIFTDKATVAAGLATAKTDEADNVVVDVYAIDVSTKGGRIVPTKLREAIRAAGPTIHPAFGKPGSHPATAEENDHVSI